MAREVRPDSLVTGIMMANGDGVLAHPEQAEQLYRELWEFDKIV